MGLREVLQNDPTIKKALAWGLLAGLLTAGYTLTLPNHYRSEALVLPKGATAGPLAALAATAALLGGGGGADRRGGPLHRHRG